MSEAPAVREWRFYLDDMIRFSERVLSFTAEVTEAEFLADAMRYDATLRNIELIGEAATRIPADVRAASPEVPWRMIIATRNQLNHGYLGIDNDTLWSIISSDVESLLASLQALKRNLPP